MLQNNYFHIFSRPLGNHWASTENYQCALYLARHRQPSDRQRKLHRGINVKIAWQCCCANETLARRHSSCSWGLNCQPRSPKQNLQSSAHWLVEAPPNAQYKKSPARKKNFINLQDWTKNQSWRLIKFLFGQKSQWRTSNTSNTCNSQRKVICKPEVKKCWKRFAKQPILESQMF